jgi:hypothetical protein
MDTTTTIVIVVVVLVVLGAILGLIFSSRRRSERLQKQFGTEYDHTVESMGGDKKAQAELENRQKHVKELDIRPLSASERERYQADWAAVQSRFVDEPGQAIADADRLITEVMQLRAYPVSDFDQRAADISVKYPDLVSNYRSARAIAVRNKEHTADTEDLRNAMIHYRSLFDELLKAETA